MSRFGRWLLLCKFAVEVFGCRHDAGLAEVAPSTSLHSTAALAAPPHAAMDRPKPYPPGSWRHTDGNDLAQSVVWLSHILIRHEEVSSTEVSFTVTGWQSSGPRVNRTRREALVLAEQLAASARAQGNFAALARQFSEDPESSVRGGSLGGIIVRHLAAWPEVLDAVEVMRPREVSDAVATRYGYHVLYRQPPPPETTLSGAQIVIGHNDAPWLRMVARERVPRRTRKEALELASRIYEEARSVPSEFDRLARRYSEHRDAERGGDFGTWSSHEPSGYPRELETLSQLSIGEVAEPIDSMFGYKIIQRSQDRPRVRYAMEEIQLRFDPAKPDSEPDSKSAAYARAQRLLQLLRHNPSGFRAMQEQECCVGVRQVIEGRELPALDATLAALMPGQIAVSPIEDVAVRYIIAKRVELTALKEMPRTSVE